MKFGYYCYPLDFSGPTNSRETRYSKHVCSLQLMDDQISIEMLAEQRKLLGHPSQTLTLLLYITCKDEVVGTSENKVKGKGMKY